MTGPVEELTLQSGRPLRVLVLSDGRPGHYHQSEGVVAALGRVAELDLTTVAITPRLKFAAIQRWLAVSGVVSAKRYLSVVYGLNADSLPEADLVVSAGGKTIGANIALARHLKCSNVFSGTLRGVAPENFSLIVVPYTSAESEPRHLVVLKPSQIDAKRLNRPDRIPQFGADNPPKVGGVLIGGDSGKFHYRIDEWRALSSRLADISKELGTRWWISTSPRTGDAVSDFFAEFSSQGGVVDRFIDFRNSGPGSLEELFSNIEIIVASQDSSSMISEAVTARFPVIAVAPETHSFKADEAEYRKLLEKRNWCRYCGIGDLTSDLFVDLLRDIRPMEQDYLTLLGNRLNERLPELFQKSQNS